MSTKNPTTEEINAAIADYRKFRDGHPVESGRMSVVRNVLADACFQFLQDVAKEVKQLGEAGEE